VTRAVIKLEGDISYAMPIMERIIEGCAYSKEVAIAAFRYKDFGVIVHSRDITINNAGVEASAVEVMNFLKDIVNNADEITRKVNAYKT
jgi:ArsR family metal-binding transcriptional regulator